MWSAMAFINSGGTLFPTRAPSAVANFPECRFWPACQSVSAKYCDKCYGFSYPRLRRPTIIDATPCASDRSVRIANGGILRDRQGHFALPDHRNPGQGGMGEVYRADDSNLHIGSRLVDTRCAIGSRGSLIARILPGGSLSWQEAAPCWSRC